MNKKAVSAIAFLLMLLFSTLTATLHFGTVQASTNFNGVITSDTTWTKANSPYNLKGPVAVNSGVTLTVEAGVTVNLNGYYIRVNGTLVARGTGADKVYINSGNIEFTSVSNGWNEETQSGSIIENAIVNGSISISSSAKITNNSLKGLSVDGSSTVSYNSIDSIDISGSPAITNNEITGDFTIGGGSPIITANTIQGRPWARGGTPVFSGNKIFDGIHADSSGGPVTISNNEISSKNNWRIIYVAGIHADISNNKIIGNNNNPSGIQVGGVLSSASITQNQIYGCQTGIEIQQCNVQITQNAIFNNNMGINIVFSAPIPGASGPWATNPNATIEENTIANNSIGIQYAPYVLTSTIANNNIQDNSQYNFKLQYPNEVTIPNNWWGTADSSLISQTIYDSKYDFNLGNVNFAPFLTAPNPEAPPIPIPTSTPISSPTSTASPTPTYSSTTMPTSTPTPSQSPSETSSPSQNPTESPTTPQTGLNGIEIAILAVLIVIAALLAGILAVLFRKRR